MLDHVKNYLRIDGVDDDPLINSLISASKHYIKNGTGVEYLVEPTEMTGAYELYRICVCMLVTHWYENREPIGQANTLVYSMESLFIQLKYCYETEVIT